MGFRDHDQSRRARIEALLAEREEHEERIEALEERIRILEARLATQDVVSVKPVSGKATEPSEANSKTKVKPKKKRSRSDLFWRCYPIFVFAVIIFVFFMMFRGLRR